jgi:hypothetical protein
VGIFLPLLLLLNVLRTVAVAAAALELVGSPFVEAETFGRCVIFVKAYGVEKLSRMSESIIRAI